MHLTADLDGDTDTPPVTQLRQRLGPGGHAGKMPSSVLHFGLGQAEQAEVIEVHWPGATGAVSRFTDVAPGHYHLDMATGALQRLSRP